MFFFFFKQKTAYYMRISDWSSDVCSSDLVARPYVACENLAASDFCDAIDPELCEPGGRIPVHGGQQLLLEERRVGSGPKRRNVGEIGRASWRERVCQ